MKKKNKASTRRAHVVKATRDAVVRAAVRVELLKQQTAGLAKKAEKKWEASKPQRTKAENELKKAAQQIVDFEKDVREGLKQGLAEIKKKNKNRK